MDKDIKYLDCFGDICPLPVLKVENELKSAKVGDSVMIATDHSCVVESIKEKYSKGSVKIDVNEVMNGVWEITFTKMR